MSAMVNNPTENVTRKTPMEPDHVGEERMHHLYDRGKEKLLHAKDRVVEVEKGFEAVVKAHPVRSVLIAAGVGALFGVLLGRRR